MKRRGPPSPRLVAACVALLAGVACACAQEEPFKGKAINVNIGFATGGNAKIRMKE
jgi:hypothetical protein